MTRQEAINILQRQGWNDYGAEAIVDTVEEHGLISDMTEDQLKTVGEDYMDR